MYSPMPPKGRTQERHRRCVDERRGALVATARLHVLIIGIIWINHHRVRLCDVLLTIRANTSRSTSVRARVTPRRRIPFACGAFVAAVTQLCPRFPRLFQDGKEEAAVRVRQRLENPCK